MRKFLLLLLFMHAVTPGSDIFPEPALSETGEPACKMLYENGFYEQAIEFLNAKIKNPPDTADTEFLKYLAFCYSAQGKKDSAEAAFCKLLGVNSSFYLDTIFTSPSILDFFNSAKEKMRASGPADDTLKHVETSSGENLSGCEETAAGGKNTLTGVNFPSLQIDSAVQKPEKLSLNGWYKVPLCFVPLGAPQFSNRKPYRGIVFLALQAAGMGAAIWASSAMNGCYDPVYGWYEGNRARYEKYSFISRASFLIFAGAYAGSAADGLVFNWKSRKGKM